jgi:hypothetical protein
MRETVERGAQPAVGEGAMAVQLIHEYLAETGQVATVPIAENI